MNRYPSPISSKLILDSVLGLTGDALPYSVVDGEPRQLPEDPSFLNMSETSLDMPYSDRGQPYDLIYLEDPDRLSDVYDSLHPKGKVFLFCSTRDVREVVGKAHKTLLFWAEWKQLGDYSGIVFRKQRKPDNLWKGEGTGSVYVYSEWGWGDLFQNLRYLNLLRERVGPVTMEARQGLERLLEHCPVDHIVSKGDRVPDTDFSFELCDAKNYFGFLQSECYLSLPRNKRSGFNTGVSWRGHHLSFNRQRDFNPDLFEKLLIGGNQLHCIQKFTEETDCPHFINQPLLNDWLDTARLINEMNLIVTVDTSVAHLAAAMGKETWVLLAQKLYYTPIHTDPSWYPTVKIYHDVDGNWSCIDRLSGDLYSKLGNMLC